MPPRCSFGSVGYEAKRSADGQIFTWLERRGFDRMDPCATRERGYSEIISPQRS
jgi:hypothetical protein